MRPGSISKRLNSPLFGSSTATVIPGLTDEPDPPSGATYGFACRVFPKERSTH